jgi:hypothetical protein
VLPGSAWKTCENEKTAVSGRRPEPYYIETSKVAVRLAVYREGVDGCDLLRLELLITADASSYRPLFPKGLMCNALKIKWSGRVDSNHRPPGPEYGFHLSTALGSVYFQQLSRRKFPLSLSCS